LNYSRILAVLALLCLALGDGPALAQDQGANARFGSVFALPADPLRGAVPFSSYVGRPALIVLFQPNCPYCLVQFREAQAFARQRPDIIVVSVALRGRASDLVSELRCARSTLPAYSASPALLSALGAPEGTPRVYVVTPRGRVIAQARGLQNQEALAQLAVRTQR
jgi:hypothetical protein